MNRIMKKSLMLGVLLVIVTALSGCNWFDNEMTKLKEQLKGNTYTVQTYDEESNVIDQFTGKSISIKPDERFATKGADGTTIKDSSLIEITIGGKSILHVGSTLVAAESGLENLFDEFAKTYDLENHERSIPIINTMYNRMKNNFNGKSKVVLIRSQTGKPLATYAGESVSHFPTDIDKSTGLIIDGKFLFIYRADYTIIETELFE